MKYKMLAFLLCLGWSVSAQVTAEDVVETLKSEVTVDWRSKTVDTFKAGNPKTEVKGIATTFMATMDVLKKAKAKGLNFVIAHEPTFYSHLDDMKIHAGDPIQEEKLKFIQENDMVVFRFHDHIHATNPDQIYEGVVAKLDWAQYQNPGERTFTIPENSLKDIVADIEKKFKARTVRVVGDPEAQFSKVGLALGAAGSGRHFEMLANPNCELLIVGESNEWETVPYVLDAEELGYNKALIILGHADSEEAGMDYFANWLKQFYPSIPIEFIPAKNPLWRN
ncbi:Nif3-like dinuclear metal center hexameric protein [Marinilongibacter aquaticus]|uniref:Nif3-like dinuclear metal center hexameric protein n=1 Tax=Marinilongibacter aquaticus TaxID=2975157 RepID=UPI0021BD65DD|nr:Nif3-like dinuclear metal center hexameric protein [Marinilongibacter aquaticus]UBM59867.1 Nif3-like dinuclear metal center hexameric protein [Marinilongibacter aquaticus]